MSSAVIQKVPIEFQWPTIDPFLFCVHHVDHYPIGNGAFGPAELLVGRDIGQDFANVDGWNMYHGAEVPGFPQHPHRGFETVTFVRRGLIDHSDSMGARARYGQGDVQWLTAGRGVVHAEMFPLLNDHAPNPAELFQIWINLPAINKMADPHFTMLWDEHIPRVDHLDSNGHRTQVTVIAGQLGEAVPLAPPPSSWASVPGSDVAIWHIRMEPNAAWSLPAATCEDTTRVLYLFEGGPLIVDGQQIEPRTACQLAGESAVNLVASGGLECLLLQGRPIAEPVARYGPFVMNTEEEIRAAFSDYRATQFGGWPWSADGPVHGADPQRFAQRPDGTIETANSA